jgi:LPXTG-motif cell wall-anchored protein
LLAQEQTPSGFRQMNPFLVSVPITVNGQIRYNINAFPKLEKIREEKLPQTGQRKQQVWALMGGGIVLIGLGIHLRKRK